MQTEEMISSRQIAFETLYSVLYDNAFSNIELDKMLSGIEEGKAFASRLVYGVIERKITLDYIIEQYCKKAKPKVKTILRMGTYQIYFMDKVPVSAAVDESVKLAKDNGLSFYSGMINAVLHNIANNIIDINTIDDLSIRYSIPQSLINMLSKAYTEEAVKSFLPYINEGATVFAVPNYTKADADGLVSAFEKENIKAEKLNDIVIIKTGCSITELDAYKKGLFHIQDLSCFNAVKALDIQRGETVVDVCAAPGGKSFTAASLSENKAKIYSFDIHKHRVELIKKGAERLGYSSINAEVNDACEYNERIPECDKIICDVPCSGFGIIRRKPEIKYKDLDSIKELPALQLKILTASSKYLKKNGRLLYSTCTLNKRENEKVIERFLDENKGFVKISEKTVFPGENGADGFYYCIIERVK